MLSAIDQAISGWMAGRYRPDAAAPPGDYPQQEPGSTAHTTARCRTGRDSGPSGSSPTPFWRKQGLDGFVLSLDDEFHVLDNSPPESSCGGLACFIEAAHARTATEMTGNERRKLITSTL